MKTLSLVKIPKYLVVSYVCSTLIVAARNFMINLLTAYMGSGILDAVSAGSMERLGNGLLLFCLCVVGFVIFDSFGIYWQSVTIHGILNRLRSVMYEKVLRARYDALNKPGQSEDLLFKLNSDVNMISSVLSYGLLSPVMCLISGIGATAVIFRINLWVGLGIYAFGLFYLLYRTIMMRKESAIRRVSQKNTSESMTLFLENHSNGIAIRMCNLTEDREKKVSEKLGIFENLFRKNARLQVWQGMAQGAIGHLQSVGMLIAGIWLYGNGHIMLGDIVILYQMAALIVNMITSFTSVYSSLRNAYIGYSRCKDTMLLPEEGQEIFETGRGLSEERNELSEEEYGVPEKRGEMSGKAFAVTAIMADRSAPEGIAAERLSCILNDYSVFENLNLYTKDRGLYLLTGESGKGKTTFFRLLVGLYPCQAGILRLYGKDQASYSVSSLREQITYCTQENAIFHGTLRENLVWRSGSVTDERIWEVLEDLELEKWIRHLEHGLDTQVSNGGQEFSGGQRKGLLFARALLEDKPLMLLDEVFAGVDRRHMDVWMNVLKERAEKSLILMISHEEGFKEVLA